MGILSRIDTPAFDHLRTDLHYAWRSVRRSPAFYGTAMVVLALGIGLNAAMFSIFSAVLLSPLQFPDASHLFIVSSHAPSLGDQPRANSGPDFRDFRDQATTLSGVAAAIGHFSEVWTGDGAPRVVNCAGITQSFFDVLGVKPILGRGYDAGEYKTLNDTTAVISYKFWQSELGGDPKVIGRTIHIGGGAPVIVGVMPPLQDLYPNVDIWLKLTTEPAWPFMDWRANKFLDVIARVKPSASTATAEQQLAAILRRASGEPADVQVRLLALKDHVIGPVRRQLSVAMLAVIVVLLVTSLNTAALLLCRAVKRSHEIAIRIGHGATPSRIRQQLLIEALVLSSVAAIIGLSVAAFVVRSVPKIPGLALPRVTAMHLNLPALGASLLVVIVTSVAIALATTRVFTSCDFYALLRSGRTETGRAQRRPFNVLVVAEVACAAVLTISAGLLLRSFEHMQSLSLGYQPERVVTAYLRTNFDNAQGIPFWHDILDRTAHIPGAVASALTDCMPGSRANRATLGFSDRAIDDVHAPSSEACWISPEYFRTLGAPLLRGRYFSDHDDANAEPVVIINDAAAKSFFPGQDPIGKQIAVKYIALGSRLKGAPRMRLVVGVVGDLRQRAIDLPTEPALYMPYEQDETFHVLNSMNLLLRSAGSDPAMMTRDIQTVIQKQYPSQPVEGTRVLTEVVAQAVARRTYTTKVMTGFAALAIVLCSLGIYGVVSFTTLQRRREFGIRIALGARRSDVIRNVLAQGASLAVIGCVVGLGVSIVSARALAQLLFETRPADPLVFSASLILLAAVALAACVIPGIRATQVDPIIALRSE